MSSQQERPDVVSSEMHLLLSRLQPPRLSSPLVKRERLLTLLDAACSHPLTLLLAPAGFGKTTLVAQWITDSSSIHEQKLPVSWLSLEESDNDPARFWHYVIAAIQNFHAEVSAPARLSGMFPISFEQSFQDRVLTPLLNTLTLHACHGLLILEDYHTITEPAIHKTLAFFLDHLPDSLHIVMLSRSEPPLPLARWRARGAVHEIQATDLRFSPKETATFFQQTLAFPLTEETLHRLDAQLEGWAAGLRLLTLTLQRRTTPPDVEQSLSLLTSTHRPILDYFISEVLSAQPEPLQRFLLQTSVLSRLNGSLCDAVTGRQDSRRLLEETERAGLFLQPLNVPGLWYRYHELFAEALRYTARHRLGEEALHTLLLRACQWYETHAMLDEAIETALAIHEYARAAPLIERSNAAQLSTGAFQRLFLDEGEPLAILLRTVLPEISDAELHAYATTLVLTFSDPVIAPGKSEPDSHLLSLQEQRILHLLAAGHSKPAIAQKLIVSLNTVKTHVKNIYRKLGATNRQEAIARARALRLLS